MGRPVQAPATCTETSSWCRSRLKTDLSFAVTGTTSNNTQDDNSTVMTVVSRVHLVHLMNVDWRQLAANSQTKPVDLGRESACRLQFATPTVATYYYSEDWSSFYRPTEGRRLSRRSWLVTYLDCLPTLWFYSREFAGRITLVMFHGYVLRAKSSSRFSCVLQLVW